MKKLLVNYVYWQPVGHAVEGLRYTLGYHKANPDSEISLVLNKHTAVALANLCPWVKKTYTVDLPNDRVSMSLDFYNHIPREWDYVVSDDRYLEGRKYCPGAFYDYYRQTEKYFLARLGKDYVGDNKVPYEPNQDLQLTLPKSNLVYARKHLLDTKLKVGIMPAGGKEHWFFPSLWSWQKIIESFYQSCPDISIYLFGKLGGRKHTTFTGFSRRNVKKLLKKYPNVVDCFDLGLLNQLAIVRGCNIFVSPHTGFGFAVLAVGTLWLTIAGGRWPEYFYNGVPFYSVLPDPSKYPSFNDSVFKSIIKDGKDGKRILGMSRKRILDDLPEILKGASVLINKKWNYEKCLRYHFNKLKKFYKDPKAIWSFDNIHKKYI